MAQFVSYVHLTSGWESCWVIEKVRLPTLIKPVNGDSIKRPVIEVTF